MISIVYGAFAAMAQNDFKRLVAYSSVSHMGYVILGIARVVGRPARVAILVVGHERRHVPDDRPRHQLGRHVLMVGVIYDRAHHRNLDKFGGLYEPMPLYGGISAVIFFAALGLPGLCGFIGEFMVVLSTWNLQQGLRRAGRADRGASRRRTSCGRSSASTSATNPAYKRLPGHRPARAGVCIIPLVVLAVLLGVLPVLAAELDGTERDRT